MRERERENYIDVKGWRQPQKNFKEEVEMKNKMKRNLIIFLICLTSIQINLFARDKIQNGKDFQISFLTNNTTTHFHFSNDFFEYYDNTDWFKISFKTINDLGNALEIQYKAQINSSSYTWVLYVKKDLSDYYVENGLSNLANFMEDFDQFTNRNPNFAISLDQLASLFNIETTITPSKTKKITIKERLLCTVGTIGAYFVFGPIGGIIYSGVCLSLADLS